MPPPAFFLVDYSGDKKVGDSMETNKAKEQPQIWRRKTVLFIISQAITLFGSSIVQMAIIWQVALETSSGLWGNAADLELDDSTNGDFLFWRGVGGSLSEKTANYTCGFRYRFGDVDVSSYFASWRNNQYPAAVAGSIRSEIIWLWHSVASCECGHSANRTRRAVAPL